LVLNTVFKSVSFGTWSILETNQRNAGMIENNVVC
jgi:hypothetical protein